MSSGYLVETADRKVLFDFGPGAYHRMLEAGVRAAARCRHRPRPVVREIRSGEVIDCDGFRVHARSVLHAQLYLECLACRMEADGSSFAYSGDAGPCKAMEQLARDCDVLVHMCHFHQWHRTERRNGQAQYGAPRARSAWLCGRRAQSRGEPCHRTHGRAPGVRERLIREMSALYAGNLFFGEDLMEIPVAAPAPARLD